MDTSGVRLLVLMFGVVMFVEMFLAVGMYQGYENLNNRINIFENKINLINNRDIQTDYDLYTLAVGNNVAGSVLSNLDIPLSSNMSCDVSKVSISNIHFGNKGMQIWYNEFEKGNVMTTLVNRTKIYQVGENKTAVSADEFCIIIKNK